MLKPGWTTEYPISLPASAAVKTNALYEIAVPYSSEMQSSFNDLRFIDSDGTQLEQVRKSYTSGVTSSWIFRVPSKPIPGKTIYLCTGRDVAELLSDLDVSFTDLMIESNISEYYQYGTGVITHEENLWTITGDPSQTIFTGIRSNAVMDAISIMIGQFKLVGGTAIANTFLAGWNLGQLGTFDFEAGYRYDSKWDSNPKWQSNDGAAILDPAPEMIDDTWHTIEVRRITDGTVEFYFDHVYRGSLGHNEYDNDLGVYVQVARSSVLYIRNLMIIDAGVTDLGTYEILDDVDITTGETLSSDINLNSYLAEIKHDANLTNLKNIISNQYLIDVAYKDLCDSVLHLGGVLNQRYRHIVPVAISGALGTSHSNISHVSGSVIVTGFSGLTIDQYENGSITVVDSDVLYNAKITENDADTITISDGADLPVLSNAVVFISQNNSNVVIDISSVSRLRNKLWGVWDAAGYRINKIAPDMAENIDQHYDFNGTAYWYQRGDNLVIALGSGAALSGFVLIGIFRLPNKIDGNTEIVDFPIEYRDIPQSITAARLLTKVNRKKEADYRMSSAARLIEGVTKRSMDKQSLNILLED